ncbi:MAG: CopG family transcriptional regulator [Moorellaceae bacterium]
MQRTQIYLHPEQHQALLNEAAQKGVSLAELVRQIVEEHLERRVKPPGTPKEVYLRIVGIGASGKTDISERHDHYLAEALSNDNG